MGKKRLDKENCGQKHFWSKKCFGKQNLGQQSFWPKKSVGGLKKSVPWAKKISSFKGDLSRTFSQGGGVNLKIERNTFSKYVLDLWVEQFTSGCEARFGFFYISTRGTDFFRQGNWFFSPTELIFSPPNWIFWPKTLLAQIFFTKHFFGKKCFCPQFCLSNLFLPTILLYWTHCSNFITVSYCTHCNTVVTIS